MSLSARSWQLERYAFQVSGKWEHLMASPAQPLTLSILAEHRLLITHGPSKVLESFSFWDTYSWMKGVRRGGALLIMMRSPLNDTVRKVRFKFLASEGLTAEGQAIECGTCLAAYMRFEKEYTAEAFADFSSQSAAGEAGESSVSEMARLMSEGYSDLGEGMRQLYASTHLPNDQMRTVLTLCLADPNFPGFVAQVEKTLNQIRNVKPGED